MDPGLWNGDPPYTILLGAISEDTAISFFLNNQFDHDHQWQSIIDRYNWAGLKIFLFFLPSDAIISLWNVFDWWTFTAALMEGSTFFQTVSILVEFLTNPPPGRVVKADPRAPRAARPGTPVVIWRSVLRQMALKVTLSIPLTCHLPPPRMSSGFW